MLNPNEAPEGYIAVMDKSQSHCSECAFNMKDCDDIPCSAKFRQDKTNVYFIKKEPEMKHIHADLIKAWADGAEIEIYDKTADIWMSVSEYVIFHPNAFFRVKPIPLVPDSINWDHVHPDYKYMARDENGDVYLYEQLPKKFTDTWGFESVVDSVSIANAFTSLKVGTVDWKDSLVTRP